MKFFLINFDKSFIFVEDVEKLKNINFFIDGIKNYTPQRINKPLQKEIFPISFERYKTAFDKVKEEIKNGNTYILNLTFPTKVKHNYSMKEIFHNSDAKFKLNYKDKFVCFSPERFVKIENNKIFTYPMKGTIDASIPNAKEKILNNPKELAEHIMIVDLLRNDLGMVAKNIKVDKFRYLDKIKAGEKELFQVSSQISGELEENWENNWLELILKLLPAGSISGTPKKSSCEIIKNIENYERGFYTGIFGIMDKGFLDSGVIIRYIEEDGTYKSGGGITLDSILKYEYQELIDKIY